MKRTAVEWLKYLYENQGEYEEFIMDDQWKKALEMEREQTIRFAMNNLENNCYATFEGSVDTHILIEDYYDELFDSSNK
jgi:hypothetical protein